MSMHEPLPLRTQLAVAGLITGFGVAWFWLMGGFNVFNPFNIDWMLGGDWQAYRFVPASPATGRGPCRWGRRQTF